MGPACSVRVNITTNGTQPTWAADRHASERRGGAPHARAPASAPCASPRSRVACVRPAAGHRPSSSSRNTHLAPPRPHRLAHAVRVPAGSRSSPGASVCRQSTRARPARPATRQARCDPRPPGRWNGRPPATGRHHHTRPASSLRPSLLVTRPGRSAASTQPRRVESPLGRRAGDTPRCAPGGSKRAAGHHTHGAAAPTHRGACRRAGRSLVVDVSAAALALAATLLVQGSVRGATGGQCAPGCGPRGAAEGWLEGPGGPWTHPARPARGAALLAPSRFAERARQRAGRTRAEARAAAAGGLRAGAQRAAARARVGHGSLDDGGAVAG